MHPLIKILYTLFCFLSLTSFNPLLASNSKIDYWNTERKGANFFNKIPSPDWFTAAHQVGIEFARLAPDKWECNQRDFLIGDADHFTEISSHDLQKLKEVLDDARRNNVKVVLTLLSLPGSRWKQNNHDQDDLRLWQEPKYKEQATTFWKQLATALKDHPALVGYNLLNEPHPELLCGMGDYREIDFDAWYASVKGSSADLNLFYQDVVKAIREVDLSTPIILDTGLYATPWAIRYLKPLQDQNILYSFHMYEPFAYTARKINKERYTYPGNVPLKLEDAEKGNLNEESALYWDQTILKAFLEPISEWQKQHHIPSSQILVGEFGCDRTARGAQSYLRHLTEIFNAHHWHWAFYSFREDGWDNMDYELGSGKLSSEYWESVENGQNIDRFRTDNPLFDVMKRALKKSKYSYNFLSWYIA